jgi:DNA-binding NtrC family response regulator
MLTMKTLKTTRAVTYRRPGIPAIILEGHWLTKKYRLEIGDQVDIDYQPKELRLKKNVALSLRSQKRRELKRELKQDDTDAEQGTNESTSERGIEASRG